jgi:hypothetical protein
MNIMLPSGVLRAGCAAASTRPAFARSVAATLICEAVTEAKGKAAADNIAALKKGDMADRAAEAETAPAGAGAVDHPSGRSAALDRANRSPVHAAVITR